MVVALIHCHSHLVQRVICEVQNGWMSRRLWVLELLGLCKELSGGRSRFMNAELVDYYGGDAGVGRLFVYVCIR